MSVHNALDVIEKALAVLLPTRKAKSVITTYANSLTDLVERTTRGKLTARKMASGHSVLIDEYATLAYLDGMKDGGIDDPEEELDGDDIEIIETWQDAQKDYTGEYASACHDAIGDDDAIESVLERVELWRQALESLKGLGRISAIENEVGYFRLGSTDEHCDTCRRLNGQKKRMKQWRASGHLPQQPGNERFTCGGWQCECYIENAKGRQLYP